VSRPALHAVLAALFVLTAGCAFGGATTEATLSADRLTAEEVVDAATADRSGEARAVTIRAIENGTARTVGWRAIDRRDDLPGSAPYVEHEGTYYRVNGTTAGETMVERYTVGAVRAEESSGDAVAVRNLSGTDREIAGLAIRFAQSREERNGSLSNPRYRVTVHRHASESTIVAGDVEYVRLGDRTYRLDVPRQEVTETVYEYRAERVGDVAAVRERVVRPVPENLTAAERDLLESVLDGENHTVDLTAEAETPRTVTTLARKLGLPEPRETVYGPVAVVYVRYEGSFYRLRLSGYSTAA
jgi:hypothetical protein